MVPRWLSKVLLGTFIATSVFAQSAGQGSISGVVIDASDAAVANATVVVANESKGIRRTLQTNESGLFVAPALPPAAGYTVTATAAGFSTVTQKEIELLVGQQVNLRLKMQIASTATQVEVTATAPLVEDTKTDLSQVVDRKQIDDLPINGRRVDSFVLLTPGTNSDGTFGNLTFRGVQASNTFLVDGNDTTNTYYNENAGRTRIGSQISQDAVQEFQVMTANYSAEFGRAAGGIVNTVTRSGANDIHGTGYWFFRNENFNARDRYALFNPPETRNQYGGSIGGPIKKDKLFYFFNGEAQRRDFPIASSLVFPGLIDQSTQSWIGCGAPATPAQCQAANDFLQRHFGQIPREANQELFFGKIDWRPTEKHSVNASFNYLRFLSPNGIQTGAALNNGAAVGNNGNSTVRSRFAKLGWTYLPSNNTLNEFRFGWFKDRQADEFVEGAQPITGNAVIRVGAFTNAGVANFLPRVNPSENRYQLVDNFSWTRGRHAMKFGFDFLNTEDYVFNMNNQWGSYTYANPTNFALDLTGNTTGAKRYQSFTQLVGNPALLYTTRDYAFYGQDQWRITSKLTLNYGIRYEYADLPQPTLSNPDYPATGRVPTWNKNWGPRAGLAYSMFGGKTVLRAGYGIFYGRVQGGLLSTLLLQNGVYQSSLGTILPTTAGSPVFPNRLPLDQPPPAGTKDLTFAGNDLRTPYTQQGTAAIEQQVTKNSSLSVSYLWNYGLQFYTVRDLNMGALGPNVTYTIQDANGSNVGSYTTPTYLLANRVDRRYGRLNLVDNGGKTWYNAMVVQYRQRFSKSLHATVNYTWAHAIDYNLASATASSAIFQSGGPQTVYNGDYRNEKGSSTFDQRHRAVINFIWQPTFTKSTSAFAKYVINNWQISGITTLATNRYDTATVFVSNNFTGSAYPSTLNGFGGGGTRVPFWPLQSVPIDPITRVDARVSKIVPLTERFKLYLNFEAFNATNSVSDTAVNTQAYTAQNLVLRPTPGLGVGRTSGGFPDGTNARRAQFSMRLVF
jgi:hypothetical protein